MLRIEITIIIIFFFKMDIAFKLKQKSCIDLLVLSSRLAHRLWSTKRLLVFLAELQRSEQENVFQSLVFSYLHKLIFFVEETEMHF